MFNSLADTDERARKLPIALDFKLRNVEKKVKYRQEEVKIKGFWVIWGFSSVGTETINKRNDIDDDKVPNKLQDKLGGFPIGGRHDHDQSE
jgi:hypothetical protein